MQITSFPTITIQLYLWTSAAAAATIGASTSTTFRTNKKAQHPKSIPPTRRLVISIFSYSRLVRLGFTEDLLIVLDNEFWFLISRNKMLVSSPPTSPQKWLQSYKSIFEWKSQLCRQPVQRALSRGAATWAEASLGKPRRHPAVVLIPWLTFYIKDQRSAPF